MKTFTLGLALTLFAVPAAAQTAADSRWTPWLGCWELVTENVPESRTAATPTEGLQSLPSGDTRPRVCVTATAVGATFQTSVRGQTALEETIVADASDRPVNDADCRGTQRAEWSQDSLRLFSRAEVTCKDDTAPRTVSGIALLAANGTWVDIQAVEIAARQTVRVRRYRRAADQKPLGTLALPRVAGAALSLDDVKEASGKVSARALEAALVETNAGFDLSGNTLLDLDDAGVPDSVIDLIVALSYPERFVVERTTRTDRAQTTFLNDPYMLGWAFGYPMWYDDFGFYSSGYGYYSPYYYTPFGYSTLRGYDPRFGNGIIIGDGGGAIPPQPSGAGRVVDGLGYTRVRPRETTPAVTSGQTGSFSSSSGRSGTVSAQGYSSGGGSSSGSSAGSSSSGSSGGSSSGGSSSGSSSSGGDSGRTAQPR